MVGIVVLPGVAELRAEGEVLNGLPVQAGIVALLETLLILIGGGDALVGGTAGRGAVLLVLVVAATAERLNGCPAYGVGHDAVGGIRLVGVGTAVQTVERGIGETSVEVKRQPLVQVGIDLGADVVLLVARTHHDALLVVVVEADVELELFRAAADVGIVLRLMARASEDLVLPVAALNGAPDVHIVVVAVVRRAELVLVEGVVVGRHDLHLLRNLLPTVGGVERHVGLALGTALRGDDDNAVGTAGTVDGRRRGVLQHVDALNLTRSDVADARYWEAVDDVER